MMNKIFAIFLLIIISILFILYNNSKTDICDIECDNCMSLEQCQECFENCYNNK